MAWLLLPVPAVCNDRQGETTRMSCRMRSGFRPLKVRGDRIGGKIVQMMHDISMYDVSMNNLSPDGL